jgi:predicted KAP-like P-loop ATPase
MILSDNETKIDFLNNEPIARTIVALLRERPGQPITVGVHGDWGAGKSSVLEMVEAALEPEGKVLCLKFNGWRFQGFEDAKIALMAYAISADALPSATIKTESKSCSENVLPSTKSSFSKRVRFLRMAAPMSIDCIVC